MKSNYQKQIHQLFEEIRKTIEIKNELQIMRLEILEKMEKDALIENSQKAVDRIKRMIERRKQKVFNFPYAGKRIEIKADKIIVTPLRQ